MKTTTKIIKGWAARIAMTLLLCMMASATVWAEQPQKYLDRCIGGELNIHVKGWAYDPDVSARSIDVHVYVYTDLGCTNRYGEIHVIKANVPRPDVNEAKGITGNHGFDADIAIADPGRYFVKVFAIDADGDSNPQIGSVRVVDVKRLSTITLTAETTEVTLEDGDALTGTGGINTHVTIADGATVTLKGVDITNVNESRNTDCSWAGLTCAGDAVIVLADGTTNKVKGSYIDNPGIFIPEDHTLTIRGSGSLEAYSGTLYDDPNYIYSRSCGIGSSSQQKGGNIIIEGGNITAVGKSPNTDEGGPGIGTRYQNKELGSTTITGGNITITGGNVTAIGGYGAAGIGGGGAGRCSDITITGGTVIAIGGTRAAGIGSGYGGSQKHSGCGTITITSGVTSVTATSGVIEDEYPIDAIGKGYYSDDVTVSISSDLIDKTEDNTRTLWGLVLNDGSDNTEAIGLKDGQTSDVQLRGYTLYPNGDWHTLCLPFALTAEQIAASPLADCKLMELDGTTSNLTEGTLTLNFTDATAIEAGKPYIVKPRFDYTISSDDDWLTFAQLVADGETFAGKSVLLNADIKVKTTVGTADNPFSGTFDGNGHTLNLDISQYDAPFIAPFRYISNATIRKVKVTGRVHGGKHTGGIVGAAMGSRNSISNCWMDAKVTNFEDYLGGIVGHGTTSATTVSNCYLSGTIQDHNVGLIYGWGDGGGTHAAENCWVNVTFNGYDGFDLILANGGTISVTNCRRNADDDLVTQGEYRIPTSDSEVAQFLGSQWTVENDKLTLKPSTIDLGSYVFSGVTIDISASTEVNFTGGKFVGSYAPITPTTSDDLLIGSDNTLQHFAAGVQPNAFRAYIKMLSPIDLRKLINVVIGKTDQPLASDVDGDKQPDILDVVKLVDILAKGGLVERVESNVDLGLGD